MLINYNASSIEEHGTTKNGMEFCAQSVSWGYNSNSISDLPVWISAFLCNGACLTPSHFNSTRIGNRHSISIQNKKMSLVRKIMRYVLSVKSSVCFSSLALYSKISEHLNSTRRQDRNIVPIQIKRCLMRGNARAMFFVWNVLYILSPWTCCHQQYSSC